MRVEQRMEMVEKPVTVYVANDGTEFEYSYECADYEKEIRWEHLNKIKKFKDAEGFSNPNGDDTNDENSFYWFLPQSQEDINILNDSFPLAYGYLDESDIDEVICIEESQSGDEAWVSHMSSGMSYVKRLFDKLGYDVEFVKRESEV